MVNQVYALVGPHAAGKTTMISQLISMGINYVPTYTTRRYGNQQPAKKVLYRTLKKEEFMEQDFIVKVPYQGEYYGLKKDELLTSIHTRKISLIVLDAVGIKQLDKLVKQNLSTIYLMVDYVALVDRMLRMGHSNDEIKYYLEYAESNKEFDSWKITDYVVKNIGRPQATLNQILSIMGLTMLLPPKEFDALVKK